MIETKPFSVLVVDDEAPARRKIMRLLRQNPQVALINEADGGKAAVEAIAKYRPDLVFLDVQMPGMDGFDVIHSIGVEQMPRLIFVTAHDQHALRAFEVHAFDYLLKPFDDERLQDVVRRAGQQFSSVPLEMGQRLQELIDLARPQCEFAERLLVRHNDRSIFVSLEEILWIEAERNNLRIHRGSHKSPATQHTIRGTMDSLQARLDPKQFARINRSSLVRIDAIREMQRWFHGEYKLILKDGTELHWSRQFVRQRPELFKPL